MNMGKKLSQGLINIIMMNYIFISGISWKIGTSSRNNDLKMKIKDDKTNDVPGPGSNHIPCSIIEVNNYTREQGIFDDNFKFI